MRKTIASILILILVLTSISGFAKDYPQKFYDVPKDHWAFEYIAELVERGVISGYPDGSYMPMNTVTRAEWAKIMVGVANKPLGSSEPSFNDMKGHWANQYVNAAKQYMTAFENDTAFRPDIAATRESVTVALVKFKGYGGKSADFKYIADFKDQDSISAIYRKYIAVAVELGLIEGFEDSTFRGQGTLTRAEAATLLWRASQMGDGNYWEDENKSDPGEVTDEKKEEKTTSTDSPKETPATTPTETPKKDPNDIPVTTDKPTTPTTSTPPANTEQANSPLLEFGKTYEYSFDTAGEKDWYRIKTTGNYSNYSFVLKNLSIDSLIGLDVYDEYTVQMGGIATNSNYGTISKGKEAKADLLELKPNTTYYICVARRGEALGKYTFTVNEHIRDGGATQ